MRGVARFALLLGACGRVAFDPRSTDSSVDATPAVPGPPCPFGPFGAPVHAMNVNSTAFDWGPSLTADMLTLYFSSGRGGNEDLYTARRTTPTVELTVASPIVELAAAGDEEGNPSISTDELTLYWGQHKLWRARRAAKTDAWGSPEMILDEAPGMTELQGPNISYDDLTLYFTADIDSIPDRDLFVMTRSSPADPWGAPSKIPNVSSVMWEDAWPVTSPDETELYFSSSRTSVSMLYVAARASRSDPWGTPVPVFSGRSDDFDPDLSADYRQLWFATQGPPTVGGYDLFYATRTCL